MAGIYIHIPFCKQACSYCNFHFSTSLQLKEDFLNALQEEILLSEGFIDPGEIIETIYFGGGTPSLLSNSELQAIIDLLRNKFTVAADAEITLEANPDDIDAMILQQWLSVGVNRLSVGIQSFNEAELKWMNRAHSASQSLQCLDNIQAAGFTNFSVDLIYGSPLQSNEDLVKNTEMIFARNVPHISAYALTVEPKTALYKMIEQHKTTNVDDAKQAEQFQLLLGLMEEHGYEQYEISNFAKPGFRSRHNSSYWQGKAYYGFGASAHSFNGSNKRRWNIANNALYIQSLKNKIIPYEEETLTATQQLNEYIMISLRTTEGLNIDKIRTRFGEKEVAGVLQKSKGHIEKQHMHFINGSLVLSSHGKFLADGIASDLFF